MFSIIVPVYNVEKYLKKCLDSIKNQTYNNFEVIIVNDGSKDNSQIIIDEYVNSDNRFKSFIKKNGGLSSARNYGLKYVTGDYIIFLDSDDYLDINLLEQLSKIDSSYDMVKFKTRLVDENDNIVKEEKTLCDSKEIHLQELFEIEYLEPAWAYMYKTSFFIKNNFKFEKNRLHEDFGLIPYCLIKANKVYYLNYYGHYYLQRKSGIMNSSNIEKRIEDILFQFDNLINKIEGIDKDIIKIFKHTLSTRVIYFMKIVPIKKQNYYINELKKRNITNYLLENTINKKIKKLLFKYFPNIYIFLLRIK